MSTVKCLKMGHRHLKWGAQLLGSGLGGGAQHFGHGHYIVFSCAVFDVRQCPI